MHASFWGPQTWLAKLAKSEGRVLHLLEWCNLGGRAPVSGLRGLAVLTVWVLCFYRVWHLGS